MKKKLVCLFLLTFTLFAIAQPGASYYVRDHEIIWKLPPGIWKIEYSYDLTNTNWYFWKFQAGPSEHNIKINENDAAFFVRATNVQNPQVSASKK